MVALRKESVDRNSFYAQYRHLTKQSLSARRAWIEIIDYIIDYATDASLSARRAWIEIMEDLEPSTTRRVALRKESVDRNRQKLAEAIKPSVALRKESVDRNDNTPIRAYNIIKSLSARRAWIEIVYCQAMQENF